MYSNGQIEAVYAMVLPSGNQSCLDEDEENTGIRSNGPQQLVCHPARHYEQQQIQLQQYSDTHNSSRSSGNSTTYAQTNMFAFRQCVVHVPFRHESNMRQYCQVVLKRSIVFG